MNTVKSSTNTASVARAGVAAMALCCLAGSLPAAAADNGGQAAWQRPVRNAQLSQRPQPVAASGGLQGPNSRYHEAMPGGPQGNAAGGNAWASGTAQSRQSRGTQPAQRQPQAGSGNFRSATTTVSRDPGAGSCGDCGSSHSSSDRGGPTFQQIEGKHVNRSRSSLPLAKTRAVKPPANGRTIDPNIGK